MRTPPRPATLTLRISTVLVATCLFGSGSVVAQQYGELRSAAVKACAAVDPSESQSGLLGNPDGYRSYYERSRCFQDAAARFRDETLCAEVRQRRSLLWSSWGYSADRCRQLVTEGVTKDRAALEAIKRAYLAGGMKLRDVQIVRNGNGRDVDIVPAFTGTYAHGYTLSFEILRADAAPVRIHSDGYWVDATSNLRLYVRQAEIRQQFPAFTLNRPYMVRATITLNVGVGGQSGYWSDAFIDEVFPIRERSHAITGQVVFSSSSARPLRVPALPSCPVATTLMSMTMPVWQGGSMVRWPWMSCGRCACSSRAIASGHGRSPPASRRRTPADRRTPIVRLRHAGRRPGPR